MKSHRFWATFVTLALALNMVTSASAAESPRHIRALKLLVNCLNDPNRRIQGTEISVDNIKYIFEDFELEAADQLNGYTYRGILSISYPYRESGETQWLQFPTPLTLPISLLVIEQNGYMEITHFDALTGIKGGQTCRTSRAVSY